jgi:hypothetical protein
MSTPPVRLHGVVLSSSTGITLSLPSGEKKSSQDLSISSVFNFIRLYIIIIIVITNTTNNIVVIAMLDDQKGAVNL